MLAERRRSRVVRAARLWGRKSPKGREIEPGMHPTTGKLSVNLAVNGCLFSNQRRIRQRKEEKWASPFICSGSLTPTDPTVFRLWETFTI